MMSRATKGRSLLLLLFFATTILAVLTQFSTSHADSTDTVVDFAYNGTTGQDGSIQTWTVPVTGTYILETWGASGGRGADATNVGAAGGAGGYSTGGVELTAGQVLEIVVGGKGRDSAPWVSSGNCQSGAGGFGGGGSGGGAYCTNNATSGAGGGGLSLVRVQGGDVLLVAGGGGGGGGGSSSQSAAGASSNCHGAGGAGGSGGGSAGSQGSSVPGLNCTTGGRGGTQSAGGNNGANSASSSTSDGSVGGIFFGGSGGGVTAGINGNGTTFLGGNSVNGTSSSSAGGSGGGGGGYRGGGGGGQRSAGGGGGSGYIGGVASDVSLGITAQTIDGASSMPDPNGSSMVGNIGNGFVRITSACVTICIDEIVPEKGGVEGGNTITIKGKGFVAGATVTLAYDGTPATCTSVIVAADGKSLTCITSAHAAGWVSAKVQNPTPPSTEDFSYTGNIINYDVTYSGEYKLEAWGAQGGPVPPSTGFQGAYAVSVVTLTEGDALKILVGGLGGYGAGGGGSFVTTFANTPLVIAGGGGGRGGLTNSAKATNQTGSGAANFGQATQNGGTVNSAGTGGGTGGSGGNSGISNGQGAGGGGLTGDGVAGTSSTGGGKSFISGGAGGVGAGTTMTSGGSFPPGNGGLGGGAGGYNNNVGGYFRGGGGGGYSGGQGGTYDANTVTNSGGGGGGSYFIGTGGQAIAGNAVMPNPTGGNMTGNSGNGYIRITAPTAPDDSFATCANCYLYVETSIELSVSTINVELSMSGTTPYNYNSSDVQVTTNNPTGYKLFIKANGDIDAMNPQDAVCLDDSQYRFTPTTPGTMDNNKWGLQLGSSVNDAAWLTPTIADVEFPGSNTASGPGSDGGSYNTHKLWVGAKTDGLLPNCIYSTKLMITTVTNNP